MSDGYKIRDQTLPHFVTATVVDWVRSRETFAQHPKNNDIS
jgi:hypothetical protein